MSEEIKTPAASSGKTPSADDNLPDGYQIVLGLFLAAGLIGLVVGLGMALTPSNLRYDATAAQALGVAVRMETGRMLAIVGAVLFTGSGIMLTLRQRLK